MSEYDAVADRLVSALRRLQQAKALDDAAMWCLKSGEELPEVWWEVRRTMLIRSLLALEKELLAAREVAETMRRTLERAEARG